MLNLVEKNTLFRGGGFYFFCFSNIIYLQVKAQMKHHKALAPQPNKTQNPGSDISLLSPVEPLLLEKQKKSNPEPRKRKIFLGPNSNLFPANYQTNLIFGCGQRPRQEIPCLIIFFLFSFEFRISIIGICLVFRY